MKQKIYIVFVLFFLTAFHVFSQEKISSKSVYSDRITDDSGKPLSGITVRVRGTSAKAKTNANGEFSIQAKHGDLIILSKDGKKINSYTYTGSPHYEVYDDKEILSEKKRASKAKKSRSKLKKIISRDSELFNVQLDSAIRVSKTNPTNSIDFVGEALKYAGRDKSKLAQSYIVLGDAYMGLKQYDLAASNYKTAINNQKSTANTLKLAKAYFLNKQYKLSEQTYRSILKSKISNNEQLEVNKGLADAYFEQKKYQAALDTYKLTLNLTKSKPQKTLLNSKIATTLSAMGKNKEAENYFNKSVTSAKAESPQQAVIQNQKAAEFYSKNNSIDKEIQLRRSTLETLENEALDEVETNDNEQKITKSRAKLDLGNALLKQNNLNEAIPLLEASAADAEKDADIETQKDAVQKLTEAYETLGDDRKVLVNYKKYMALVDELYKQKEQEISDAVSLSKDLSEKQNRIASLEKDRELNESKYKLFETENQLTEENDRRQKVIIYSLLAGLALLLFSLFWMIRSNRQRRLANNLLALKSLRTQMNPHFIFNALNSVNSFIAQNDERTANRYLTDFSKLMRSVLVNSEEDFIPLEREIELLELYLKLEHSRFQDKFDYELIVDKEIEQDLYQIPPMLLQPYVENAVWHGLRYKDEKGFLKVSLTKKDEQSITIEIADDGIGRKRSKELKTEHQKKQKSKGMQNIKQRIKILNEMYKDKVDVSIQDLYDDETGTKVILTLKRD